MRKISAGWMGMAAFVLTTTAAIRPIVAQSTDAGKTPQVQAAAQRPLLAFEVVSIRQNTSDNHARVPDFGPTPDGYRAVNVPLFYTLLTAYVPGPGGGAYFDPSQIVGLPPWAREDRFDIVARVGESELPVWQNSAARQQPLRAMLQTMFADRFKLRQHREAKESSVLFLQVAKGGPKLKPSDPNEVHQGMDIPTGGVMLQGKQGISAYGISMATLPVVLSAMTHADTPIVDRTGLTGRYDVALPLRERMAQGEDMQTALLDILSDMGLKLTPGKAPVENLVIDHIEPPSEN